MEILNVPLNDIEYELENENMLWGLQNDRENEEMMIKMFRFLSFVPPKILNNYGIKSITENNEKFYIILRNGDEMIVNYINSKIEGNINIKIILVSKYNIYEHHHSIYLYKNDKFTNFLKYCRSLAHY